MPVLTDPVALPALLTMAAAAVFVLYAALRLYLMYRKRGAKPWSQAQKLFAWRVAAVQTVVTLPFVGAWTYLLFSSPLTNFWPYAVSFLAFIIVGTLVTSWYERRLFALAD